MRHNRTFGGCPKADPHSDARNEFPSASNPTPSGNKIDTDEHAEAACLGTNVNVWLKYCLACIAQCRHRAIVAVQHDALSRCLTFFL
jgi:hypothetical protein